MDHDSIGGKTSEQDQERKARLMTLGSAEWKLGATLGISASAETSDLPRGAGCHWVCGRLDRAILLIQD